MPFRITINTPAMPTTPAPSAPSDGDQVAVPVVPDVEDTPIIEIEGLSLAFGETSILDTISLQISRGEMVAIVGESGCGKTMLLKSIIGLIPPTSGCVWFDGQDLTTLPHAVLTRERQRFGFVFQMAALFDSMTIGENIAFPLEQHTDKTAEEVDAIVSRLLSEVGLPATALGKKPSQLSGGMRKRVGFARALALAPEVILLDEPTTGLDPIMSDIIDDLIVATQRRHKFTGVMVTHDMASAAKVANRIIMIAPLARLRNERQVIFDGTPDEFAQSHDHRIRDFLRQNKQ